MAMISFVQLDPNGLCNAKCWFCPVAYLSNPPIGKKTMPIEVVESVLRQLREGMGDFVNPQMEYIFPFHYNEILIYKEIEPMLELFRKYNFKMAIASNGVNLTPTKVDLLRKYADVATNMTINVPSSDPDRWALFTGFNRGLHEKVMSNIQYAQDNLQHIWGRNELYLQVNGVKESTLQENGGTIKLLDNAPKIDLNDISGDLEKTVSDFKRMFPYLRTVAQTDLVDRAGWMESYNVMTNSVRSKINENKKIVGCNSYGSRTEDWIHISANGDVFMCCQDYDFKTTYANIMDKSLKDIWNSMERQDMIKNMYGDFCKSCTYARWE